MRPGFKRRAVLIGVVTVVLTSVFSFFGIKMVHHISEVEERWTLYSQRAAEAERLLDNVAAEMGYGGFIHNFKDFIMRQDPAYLPVLEQKRDVIHDHLNQLEQFTVREEEKDALLELKAVVVKYSSSIPVAQAGMARGLTPAEVDAQIQIDDTPALAALDILHHSFFTRRRIAESEITHATDAAASMGWVLLGVAPFAVILGVVLILFLRRVMDANANLSEVRDELTVLLRQAPDAILHVGGDGTILRANDRALTLFGYTREELKSKRVEDLIPNRFRGNKEGSGGTEFDQVAHRTTNRGTVLFAKNRNGEDIPVDLSLNFTTSGGKRIATVIVRDVTERKRAEDALRQVRDELELRVRERTRELVRRTGELEAEITERQRAEAQLIQSAKMATIGQMASGITHELNQPMNIMRMSVEASQLQIERGQADISSLSDTLERVEGQILRMSEIINHMRVYARQDRALDMVFSPLVSVSEGCQLFEGQLKGKDIELVAELPDVEDPEHCCPLLGHGTRLEQVLLNLLSNARDAIVEKRERSQQDFPGKITLRFYVLKAMNDVVIEVEDNGGGIDDEVLPHIFAPFVTTKDSGHGTGLGLSISYSIVEGMGGAITASNGAEGACMTMRFPMASAEDIERANKMAEHHQAPGKVLAPHIPLARPDRYKVLVVDDETNAAHSLADYLQDEGYLVYTAYNGDEALQIYQSDPVNAVITDLRMPVMSGPQFIRELRNLAPTIPVFAMTGHAAKERDELIDRLGVIEVWSKPISLGNVAKSLAAVCGPAASSPDETAQSASRQ